MFATERRKGPGAGGCACSLLLALAFQNAIANSCPPEGVSRQQLLELKSREFKVADDAQIAPLAIGLLPCLGDPDPALRDGVAYEALSTWMHGKQVSAQTAIVILNRLQPLISADFPDQAGFIRPFSALVLADVVHMDRIESFMSDAQREALLRSATSYLKSVRDYRGFDEQDGWRHGVAHGADLLMQLSQNPKTSKTDLDLILAAVATQIAPEGEHFYVHGEGERLAAPVFFVAQRQLHSAQEWQNWLKQIASPAPLSEWAAAFQSQRGLARHHNTRAFLGSLYLFTQENGDAAVKERLAKPIVKAISALQ